MSATTSTILTASRSLDAQFDRLARQWREETAFMSSVADMEALSSFKEIVAMGAVAIPLLLRQLENNPYYWFWPLHAITGENPVPPAADGDVERMSAAWLTWGRTKGYHW